MPKAQMMGGAKPQSKIRAGDTVVCNYATKEEGKPGPQERVTINAFYPEHFTLVEYPDLKLPLTELKKNFNYIRTK